MASIISAGTSAGTSLNLTGDTSGILQLASNNGTVGLTLDASQNLTYVGALTGGTGIVNLGSGQFYKDASGNVGIGTSSPAAKLDVAGAVNLGALQVTNNGFYGQFAANRLILQNEGTSNTRLYYCGANTSTYGVIQEYSAVSNGSPVITRTADNTVHIFYTIGSERMRIDSSGRLLIGVTSSLNTAFVSIGGWNSGTYLGTVYQPSNSGAFTAIGFNNSAGTQQGYISCNGSGTTSYVTSSDYRLKDDIQPMTGALDRISALKPVTYKWKTDGSDGQGFIAHELQAVVPDCVSGEKDAVDAKGNPIYQGIDTSFLVATLTAAIQEQQALITDLQTRLTKAGL